MSWQPRFRVGQIILAAKFLLALIALALIAGLGVAWAEKPAAEPPPPSVPQLIERLQSSDPAIRNQAIWAAGPILFENRESLWPVLLDCSSDPDPAFRRSVVIVIGQYLIWNATEQDPRAIELLLRRLDDEDAKVVDACVYYGLSKVENKSDELISRLIGAAASRARQSDTASSFSRVVRSLRWEKERAIALLQKFVDTLPDSAADQALQAIFLGYEMDKFVPERLERFQDSNDSLVLVTVGPPHFPRSRLEAETTLRQVVGEQGVEIRALLKREGVGAAIWIKGVASLARVLTALSNSEGLETTGVIDVAGPNQMHLEGLWRRFDEQPDKASPFKSYEQPFRELYETLGRDYPNFALKQIDWKAVGEELLPLSRQEQSVGEFSLLCQRLVARLEDSHVQLLAGTAKPIVMPLPNWDPGFACLLDDRQRPVIYYLDAGGPAEKAGLTLGTTIVSVNGQPAAEAIEERMKLYREFIGFSSDRALRYDAVRGFIRQRARGVVVKLEVENLAGERRTVELPATYSVRYLPRVPVPIEGINESADVSWKRLGSETDSDIGYLQVRRIRGTIIGDLDRAIGELGDCKGLIIDVRGNSGGGFEADRALRNFDPADAAEPERPRFTGPIAVLIDARCISAGEGWWSWFKAKKRATFVGETTAGASSRKNTVDVAGGLFRVIYPVKAYTGFLDRPIERLGIEPDVPVQASAADLARGVDTVLEAARQQLLNGAQAP